MLRSGNQCTYAHKVVFLYQCIHKPSLFIHFDLCYVGREDAASYHTKPTMHVTFTLIVLQM